MIEKYIIFCEDYYHGRARTTIMIALLVKIEIKIIF